MLVGKSQVKKNALIHISLAEGEAFSAQVPSKLGDPSAYPPTRLL